MRCPWALAKNGFATRCTKDELHIYDYGDACHQGRENASRPWRRVEWFRLAPGEFETDRDDFWAWRI